jgi:PAS domain S-box-containing protein
MDGDDPYTRNLHRLKWAVFCAAVLLLGGIESRSVLLGSVPPIEGLIDWLIGVPLIGALVYGAFQIGARLEGHTQAEAAAEELRRHNRELAFLNRASRAFAATLDLDRLLADVVEETRHLLDASACSIWLLDQETEELVCQQVTGPQSDLVRGQRLAPGKGLAGWVARHGESLIVPDAKADDRHFTDVDRVTGLDLRSILSVPLRTNHGAVGVIQALHTEVDRFQQADQALLEPLAAAAAIAIDNARLYQETDQLRAFNENIVRSMQEGILLEDSAGQIAFVNPAAAELLGCAPEALVGQHWSAIVPPERMAEVERELSRRPQGVASRYETALLARDGTRIPVIVSAKPIFENGHRWQAYEPRAGRARASGVRSGGARAVERHNQPQADGRAYAGVISVFTDIRERVRAERELRASEEQYRDLVEHISDAIYAVDANGIVTYLSPIIESLIGYTPAELVGHSFSKVVHPEDLARMQENHKRVLTGQAATNEYRLVAKNGEVRWARTSSRPAFEDGRLIGLRGVLSDVTVRVRAEQEHRELEMRLERAQRMESLGALAGGVAHDLNNILSPMVAYPELILEALPEESEVRDDVQEVRRSAEKAVAIVQDLLALGRRGVYHMAPLDLNEVVNEYLASASFVDLASRYPQVAVDVALDPELLRIQGSTHHLSKVLMNLVTNAFEAMPGGGRLAIRTGCEHLECPHAGYEQIEAGDYVALRVVDTGTGIAQEDVPRIFEPFYTKKEMGRSGTGLGLAVVYGVVHDHSARIDLVTAVGEGTELTLYFPVSADTAPACDEEDGQGCRGSEQVLVVDDLQEQRTLATRLLSALGYHVDAVESGRAAVTYLRDHSADIVVLNMMLESGLDGLDTYREILRAHPGQKAIVTSGYPVTERVKEAQRLGAGAFLRKPYTLQRLGRAVRRELDRVAVTTP